MRRVFHYLRLFENVLNLIFSVIMDAMCSLANSMIYRAVQNYKIRINYLTFCSTTVNTSISFPRVSLPRLLNLVHAAVDLLEYSSVVLNLVLEY
jgi:hypothetical protein